MREGDIYRVSSSSHFIIPDRLIVMNSTPSQYSTSGNACYAALYILLGNKRYGDTHITIPAGILGEEECTIIPNICAWAINPPKRYLVGRVPARYMAFFKIFDRKQGFRFSERLEYKWREVPTD